MKGYDNENGYTERDIPYHKCTKEEYAEFHPIVSSEETYLELYKYSGFNCIDWDDIEDPRLIFGDFKYDDVSS